MTNNFLEKMLSFLKNMQSPLLINSFYLMLASISSSFFGFLFWIIVAKRYQPEEVGVATALISSMLLIIILSRFGFDYSIIRFFPNNEHKDKIFSTSLIITTISTFILGIVFIFGISLFTPELNILRLDFNAYIYILILVANSITTLLGIIFIAMRKGKLYFIQSLLIGSRIFLVIPLVSFGSMGIFGSVGISFMLTAIVSLAYIRKSGIKFVKDINMNFIQPIFHFSTVNYITNLFMVGPNQIIPLLVFHILGKEETAYYYICFAIASLLFMIPNAVSMSLFVEGSNGESLKKTVMKSTYIISILLVPSIIFIFVKGDWLLSLIDNTYSNNGFELLKLMSISSVFMCVINIYSSIKRIQRQINFLILITGIIGVLLIVLSILFTLKFGLIGIGYAWILSYLIGTIIVGTIAIKKAIILKVNKRKC